MRTRVSAARHRATARETDDECDTEFWATGDGLSANQGHGVLGGRGRGGCHHRGRLRLGRLGHRRHGQADGRDGRGGRARHAGGGGLRRPVPGRWRRPGPAGGAEAAAELRPRHVHREGRLGDDARQGQADQRRHAALRRPAGGPREFRGEAGRSHARPAIQSPGRSMSMGRSIRACRCARWRNPRDEPGRSGPLGEATWPRRASRISSTWRPR